MEASVDDCAAGPPPARGGGVVTLWEGGEYALSDEAAISGLKQSSSEEECGGGGGVTLWGGGGYALSESESAEQQEGCWQEGEGGSGFAGVGVGVGQRRQEEEEEEEGGNAESGGLESLSSMLNELDAILGQ